MLAFLDSPVQLIVVMIVVLVVFGPQKLPEIGAQLGRALRELKRTTQDFTSAINLDDRHEPTYDPPRYDGYNNSGSYDSHETSTTTAIPEETTWQPAGATEAKALTAQSAPRGDFASPAFADPANDYNVGVSRAASDTPPAVSPAAPIEKEVVVRPASATVPRNP